eukprot:15443365-Alexandrium_andersonii.AAC.1
MARWRRSEWGWRLSSRWAAAAGGHAGRLWDARRPWPLPGRDGAHGKGRGGCGPSSSPLPLGRNGGGLGPGR